MTIAALHRVPVRGLFGTRLRWSSIPGRARQHVFTARSGGGAQLWLEIPNRPRTEPVDEENAWFERANCRGMDPEFFHPHRGESTSEQTRVCSECDVRTECFDYAMANHEVHGIWGGMSERERRRIRRDRAQRRRQGAA